MKYFVKYTIYKYDCRPINYTSANLKSYINIGVEELWKYTLKKN